MDSDDLKVLIPYKDLQDLLKAVEEIPQLRKEVKRYADQVTNLKGVYLEVLDRVGEIMKLI